MRITPKLAALAAALATAPIAAVAASSLDGIIDQGVAYLVAALVTGLMSALTAAFTKITGAKMDENARGAIQTALENGARLALQWVIAEAMDLPLAQRIRQAAEKIMLPYVESGNAESVGRFGMDAAGPHRDHLLAQAEAHLIEKVAQLSPQTLGILPPRAPAADPLGVPVHPHPGPLGTL